MMAGGARVLIVRATSTPLSPHPPFTPHAPLAINTRTTPLPQMRWQIAVVSFMGVNSLPSSRRV